jgi:hypothetical protein
MAGIAIRLRRADLACGIGGSARNCGLPCGFGLLARGKRFVFVVGTVSKLMA